MQYFKVLIMHTFSLQETTFKQTTFTKTSQTWDSWRSTWTTHWTSTTAHQELSAWTWCSSVMLLSTVRIISAYFIYKLFKGYIIYIFHQFPKLCVSYANRVATCCSSESAVPVGRAWLGWLHSSASIRRSKWKFPRTIAGRNLEMVCDVNAL